MIPTMEKLRKGSISYFGLGFIQIKMNESQRYHFWHPDFQPDIERHKDEWHDHRYAFTSHVLLGTIRNELAYAIDDSSGTHYRFSVCCAGGEPILESDATLIKMGRFDTTQGSSYRMEPDTLHIGYPLDGPAITFLEREDTIKDRATVITPNSEIITPFVSPYSEEELWNYVTSMIPQGYHLRPIRKGQLGEISKIREELEELEDAAEQGVVVMEMVELSDLIGAIEAYAHRRNLKLDDLIKMSYVTKRAFENGTRK